MRIGARIRQLRKERVWTLVETHERAGISVSFLSDMELGRTMPSLKTLARLASCFGITLLEMLRGVEIEGVEEVASEDAGGLPAALQDFLGEMQAAGQEVSPDMVDLMRHVHGLQPGRTFAAPADWRKLYLGLWALVHQENV